MKGTFYMIRRIGTSVRKVISVAAKHNPVGRASFTKMAEAASDSFEIKALKLELPKLKSPSDFSFFDCLLGFNTKIGLAKKYNTVDPIVEKTSKAIASVKKYINDNAAKAVEVSDNWGSASIKFKNGTLIKIKEPHNVNATKITPDKIITITTPDGKSIKICVNAHKNSIDAFELFAIIRNLKA